MLPSNVNDLIQENLLFVSENENYQLLAGRRIIIYNSFGNYSRGWQKRLQGQNTISLSFGDVVRAWVSWLSARKVQSKWVEGDLLIPFFENEKSAEEFYNPTVNQEPRLYSNTLAVDYLQNSIDTTEKL